MANVFNLQRHTFTDISTGGELYEPTGERVCSILEDKDRGLIQGEEETYKNKVYGETAIPYGFYEIKYLDSPHFKRKMPYLLNIPTHSSVMFHWGNTDKDTLGCLLVGQKLGHDFIGSSKLAFDDLEKVLARYFADEEKLYLQITKKENTQEKTQ